MSAEFSYLSDNFQSYTAPEQHLFVDMFSAAQAQQLHPAEM